MLKLHRKTFFAHLRDSLFRGRFTQAQVDGINDFLDAWEEVGTNDPRHLAYAFATNYHETGGKMQPVREGFKATDKAARAYVQRQYGHKGRNWYCWPAGPHGHVYYGRGDVQLTWLDNYRIMSDIFGVDFVKNPDRVLQGKWSKRILIEGMIRGVSAKGDFTGKSLEDYFNETTDDPINARRIVNGTDRSKLIAGYYEHALEAVETALEDDLFPETLEDPKPAKLPPATDQTSGGGLLAALGAFAAPILAKLDGPAIYIAAGVILLGVILVLRGRLKLVRETGE